MRIALCSDEPYPVQLTLRRLLEARGHEVIPFGAVATGVEAVWVEVAEQAASAVASRACDEGVFSCWSGTGICMAANKIHGVRAALCADPGAARAARIWNHANVLCLSNRAVSDDMAKEILEAWFETPAGDQGSPGVALLQQLDARHRNPAT